YGTRVPRPVAESREPYSVLSVGAETLTRRINMEDRTTCVLFGDGAGASIFGPSEEPGVIASNLFADGKAAKLLTFPAGGTTVPDPDEPPIDLFVMKSGSEVYKRAGGGMPDAGRAVLDKAARET